MIIIETPEEFAQTTVFFLYWGWGCLGSNPSLHASQVTLLRSVADHLTKSLLALNYYDLIKETLR